MPFARCYVMWKVVFPKLCCCLIKTCLHVDVYFDWLNNEVEKQCLLQKIKYNFFQFILIQFNFRTKLKKKTLKNTDFFNTVQN